MALKFPDIFRRKASAEPGSGQAEDLGSMRARAATALQRGECAKAIELYDALIERNSDDAEAHYKRANALNMLGTSEAALAGYDRAIALKPDYAYAFCNRGTVLERLGRWDEALASYDRTLELNPGDALAHYNRGSVSGNSIGSKKRLPATTGRSDLGAIIWRHILTEAMSCRPCGSIRPHWRAMTGPSN